MIGSSNKSAHQVPIRRTGRDVTGSNGECNCDGDFLLIDEAAASSCGAWPSGEVSDVT